MAVCGEASAKMLLAGFYKIPTWISLLLIVGTLFVSMIASRSGKRKAVSLEAS